MSATEIGSPRDRDLPLVVEGLLGEAEQLHREGALAAGVDDRIAQVKLLLAGEVLIDAPGGWGHGEA